MPAVQVRELERETYDELAARARMNHRSIAQETRCAIEAYLAAEKASPSSRESVRSTSFRIASSETIDERIRRRRGVVEAIRADGPVDLPPQAPSPEELVREDRDAR